MAARTELRRFGSYDLTPASNGVVVENWSTRIIHKAKYGGRLVDDGSVIQRDRYEGQQVNLSGHLIGDDSGDLKTKKDDFVYNMTNGEKGLQLYSDRKLTCRISSSIDFEHIPGTSGAMERWSLSLRSRTPYWEAASATTDSFSRSGAGPWGVQVDNTAAEAPTFPIIKLTNTGAAFTDSLITLTNTTSRRQHQILGISMNVGQYLYIDMREGRLGDGSTLTPITPQALDGVWFYLEPKATNDIEIAHGIGSSAGFDIDVIRSESYWVL